MPRFPNRRHAKALPDVFIEVVDASGSPLLRMPQTHVRRQNLRHKAVFVCLRNTRGDIFLHKRPGAGVKEQAGLWSLSASGHVRAGESLYDAAARRLGEVLGVTGVELHEAGNIPPSSLTDNAGITLFMTAKTSLIPKFASEGMFVDREEFMAILRDFPHQVSPNVLLAAPYLYPAEAR